MRKTGVPQPGSECRGARPDAVPEPAPHHGDPLAAFVAALDARVAHKAPGEPGLACALGAALAVARATWPELQLAPAAFTRFLAERLPPGEGLATGVGAMLHGDLYLACACAGGSSIAIAALERHHKRDIDLALARVGADATRRDEARQLLRERLFVAAGGRPPRIADYQGRTGLGRWLRTVALRVVLNMVRGPQQRERPVDADEFLALPVARGDPQLEYLKRHHHAQFDAAFREALASRPQASRKLLRRYHVDGLSLEQIAALEGVHEATISRRLTRARLELVGETRRLLREQLKLAPNEVDSLIRLIDSRLDLAGLVRSVKTGPGSE